MTYDPLMRWEWEGGAVRFGEGSPLSGSDEEEEEPGSPQGEFAEPNEQVGSNPRALP
jgi:hypothetical protein